MASKFEVGQVINGKVTGIQPYGAFIALSESTQGLVHISEISYSYVTNIQDHVQVGEDVRVKIININEDNQHVSLSLRQTKDVTAERAMNQAEPSEGFNILKEKLVTWLEESENH